eukprot:2905072-Lingulodinium_polyedra.AAC.1
MCIRDSHPERVLVGCVSPLVLLFAACTLRHVMTRACVIEEFVSTDDAVPWHAFPRHTSIYILLAHGLVLVDGSYGPPLSRSPPHGLLTSCTLHVAESPTSRSALASTHVLSPSCAGGSMQTASFMVMWICDKFRFVRYA